MVMEPYVPHCPAHILAQGVQKEWRKGEMLILQGYCEGQVFLLLSGRAQAFYLLGSGEKFNLITILPGETIGETESFLEERTPNMVELTEDSVLLQLPQTAFLQWVEEDSTFALHVMKILAYRLTDLSRKMVANAPLTVEQQCVAQLAALCRQRLTQVKKDALYGTIPATRRSCNRAVKALGEEGLVRVQGDDIIILDECRLLRMEKELPGEHGEFA